MRRAQVKKWDAARVSTCTTSAPSQLSVEYEVEEAFVGLENDVGQYIIACQSYYHSNVSTGAK